MMEGWKKVTLEEVSTKIGDGLHGTPKYDEMGEYYFVNGNNLENGKIVIKTETKKISFEQYNKIKKELNDRTILVAINGTLGNLGFYSGEPIALGKSACYINLKNEVNKYFIRYVLEFEHFQNYAYLFATGSTIKNLGLKAVRKYPFLLPPVTTQLKIASILSAYDDLIENNLKRIKLLEEKAQLTYEEWFVRMKFPRHETTPINQETGLPEGWEKVKASEKIKLISGYAFKGKEFTDEPNEHIAIRMGNFKVGGGLKTDKSKYLVDHTTVREKFHLNHNDLVMVLSDVTREGLLIGNVGFVPNDGRKYYLNQRVSKIELDDNFKMYAYATFNSLSFKHNCIAKANSVTVLNLKNDDVYGYKMLIPTQEIIDLWNRNYGATIQTTQNLERQNQFLKEARDILLPRLMTGMIDVEQMNVENLQSTTA